MKTSLKIGSIVLLIIIVLAGTVTCFYYLRYPDVDPAPSITAETTPERLARGKYVAENVAMCIDCHSTRDWARFAGPIVPGTAGMGGERFDERMGFPGVIVAKNITPSGIGSMTDGELYRTLVSGVRKDDTPLFPLMPYNAFNHMSEEDLLAVIAYIRTLKPIEHEVEETKLKFPVNVLVRMMPSRHAPVPEPNRSNPYEYGRYLVTMASCTNCHTMRQEGEFVGGMEFAGGFEIPFPRGTARSANITPDEETGIGLWTKEFFVARFKQYAAPGADTVHADSIGYNTIMPWLMYAGMSEEDLGAVYTYLRTVPAVRHKVERVTPHPRTQ